MRQMLALTVAVLVASALAANAAKLSAPRNQTRQKALAVGRPMAHGNLTVFPVYSQEPSRISTEYLTLDEALKQKVILVKEMPAAEVNRVSVTNKADKPIYLMAGDLILGGQQDREVARDTIVARGATDFAVEVFCVEHGRWSGGAHFDSGAIASSSLRRETQKSKQQQKVWDRVAQEALALKAETASGTYRAVAGSKTAQPEIEAAVKALSAPLARDRRAVGVVAAINGKVTAADVFIDHRLFEKQLPKVLKSYALDAAQQRDEWAKLPRRSQPTGKEALALLHDAGRGELRITGRSAATLNRERESDTAVVFEAAPGAAGPRAVGAGGFGGFGGSLPVHRNIYRK